jgi:hypothetical protein
VYRFAGGGTMINLKCDLNTNDFTVDEFLQFNAIQYEALEVLPLQDCYILHNCKNIPEVLPSFLEVVETKNSIQEKYSVGLEML